MEAIKIENLFDLKRTIAARLFAGRVYPWEILPDLKAFILELGKALPVSEYEERFEHVWVARDARVFDSAYLNGPLIVDHEAEVRQCAFARGSAVVGRGAVVGNSTELKNCLLFDNAQVPHFNYVGDAVLGYKAHMGAGAVTSNVRSDKQNVVVHAGGENFATGLRKFGAMLGDRAEVGCNSVLNPGAIVGRDAIVYPTSCVRGFVPARSIHKNDGTVIERRMEDHD